VCVCVCMARSTMHSVLFDRYYHQNNCEEKVRFWFIKICLFYNFSISIFAKQIAFANSSRSHLFIVLNAFDKFLFLYPIIRSKLYIFFHEIKFCQIKHCGGAHLRKNLLIQCVAGKQVFSFFCFYFFALTL